ncbi:MAG: alanine-synthesizing transaminase, partial [Oleiphilaceae bacterium]
MYDFNYDEQLILDFLNEENILFVQGTAFNWRTPDKKNLLFAIERLGIFI